MTRSPLTEAAGEYLTLGLSVIALTGKTPNTALHRTGLHSALSGAPETPEDWEFIAGFFDHAETTGVGILTQFPYVVVDIDGEDGAEQWRELVGDAGLYEEARWVAQTGRGLHLWYATLIPTGTMKLGSRLDLKGDGGYVAAPPSLHPDGHTYRWLCPPGAEAPMEAPEQLARRIEDHAYDLASALEAKEVRKRAWGPRWQPGATVFYAQPGFDALLEGMKTAEEGNRNNYLHWAAATMAEEGASDEFFEELAAIARDMGLDSVEVKRTIRSARTRG